jgi:hypothetical protein
MTIGNPPPLFHRSFSRRAERAVEKVRREELFILPSVGGATSSRVPQ